MLATYPGENQPAGVQPTNDSPGPKRAPIGTFPSPRRRFSGTNKRVDRQIVRDIKKLNDALWLKLEHYDLVLSHKKAGRATNPNPRFPKVSTAVGTFRTKGLGKRYRYIV